MSFWILALDYMLGIVMWTLIGRSAMNIFQREDSDFFFMKVFVKSTNPLLRLFDPITPCFLLRPMVPLYVAWFFYLFPWKVTYLKNFIQFILNGQNKNITIYSIC